MRLAGGVFCLKLLGYLHDFLDEPNHKASSFWVPSVPSHESGESLRGVSTGISTLDSEVMAPKIGRGNPSPLHEGSEV